MMNMTVSIRLGYSVSAKEPERVKELKKLESQGIISLKKTEQQICRKCHTPNIVDASFRRERISTCTQCGRTIQLSKNLLTDFAIKEVNYRNIIRICQDNLIKALGKNNCTFDKGQRIWICSINSKKIPVFISQISSYNQYLNEQANSCWLCIVLDWDREKSVVNHYNKLHFVRIEGLLNDQINTGEILRQLTSHFEPSATIELQARFDAFVSSINPKDFEKFEKKFVDDFIHGIQDRSELLKSYFNFLTARRNTIVNSKVVLIGGPGNPDFAIVNLLEYLQECLKPDKIGEAKRYFRATPFTVTDFGKGLVHSGGGDTISIVSTNKIQPEVWRTIIETRNKEKYFKHTIIEKDTILLLISVLGLDHLLD